MGHKTTDNSINPQDHPGMTESGNLRVSLLEFHDDEN